MFRFEDPIYLYLLLLIPVLAMIRFWLMRKQNRKLRKFGDKDLLRQLMPGVSRWRPLTKFCIVESALAMLILTLARPQMGTKISHEKRTGIETIIAMDVSNSMFAQDVEPSRLDRSKMMVENLVDNFTDDKVGLIVFAGDAFVQLPITSDYVSAKMFLSDINPSMIATQGTDVARAIDMAMHSFTQQQGIGKAIIVITDGEDHEGGAVEAAEKARKKGMRVYVLGVGSTSGSPIPVAEAGGYLKDNAGNTVMSALNEDMCKQIAKAGGGAYIHVDNNSNAQEQLNAELDKLAKKETSSTIYSDYDEQFQAFAIIALLLLIIETCLLDRKSPIFRNVALFSRRKNEAAIVCLAMLPSIAAMAQSDRQYIRIGNSQYRAGNYAQAEVAYRKALEKNPHNPQAEYNLGNALFAQLKDSAAIRSFENAARLETNPLRKAQSYHNMGVVCQSHKMFGEAIEAYKESLRLNPKDNTTRYNLEVCKRQLKEQQKREKERDKDKKEKGTDKNQKDKDNKQQQQNKQDQNQNKMSKENALQLLNAAIQQEKNTQERMKKAMQQPRSRKLDKNW